MPAYNKKHPFLLFTVILLIFSGQIQCLAQIDNTCNIPFRIVHTMDLFHPQTREINDEFSKELFQSFLEELDPGKIYFSQREIEQLVRYEIRLDDQINNQLCDFTRLAEDIYVQRLKHVDSLIAKILTKPFDLNSNETVYFKPEHYVSDDKEYNKALDTFNKTNNELNKNRSNLLNNWNKTVSTFLDKYVPRGK